MCIYLNDYAHMHAVIQYVYIFENNEHLFSMHIDIHLIHSQLVKYLTKSGYHKHIIIMTLLPAGIPFTPTLLSNVHSCNTHSCNVHSCSAA